MAIHLDGLLVWLWCLESHFLTISILHKGYSLNLFFASYCLSIPLASALVSSWLHYCNSLLGIVGRSKTCPDYKWPKLCCQGHQTLLNIIILSPYEIPFTGWLPSKESTIKYASQFTKYCILTIQPVHCPCKLIFQSVNGLLCALHKMLTSLAFYVARLKLCGNHSPVHFLCSVHWSHSGSILRLIFRLAYPL